MATKKKNAASKAQSLTRSRPRSYGEMYKNETTLRQPTAATTATKASPVSATATQDWRVEYSHVLRDLRTLLIVSAALFAIIVITGFFM